MEAHCKNMHDARDLRKLNSRKEKYIYSEGTMPNVYETCESGKPDPHKEKLAMTKASQNIPKARVGKTRPA